MFHLLLVEYTSICSNSGVSIEDIGYVHYFIYGSLRLPSARVCCVDDLDIRCIIFDDKLGDENAVRERNKARWKVESLHEWCFG